MAEKTIVEYALQLKTEGAGAIAAAAKEAEAAAKAQRDAAKAAEEKARADAEAAAEALRAAEEERERAEALERQRQAMEQLDPAMRGIVEQYKAAKKAAEEQAAALGLSIGEVQALKKASEQGTQSADEWAESLKRGEREAQNFGDGISKAGESSAKLRGALSLVSPQLGEVAGLANDAFDAMEVGVGALGSLNPLMLGLAAAGMAAAAAYVTWNREQEEAKALLSIQQRETSELTTRLRDLEDALLDAEVASGRLKDAEAERAGIDQRAQRAIEDTVAAKQDEIFAAEKVITANEGVSGALKSVSEAQLGVLSTMAATIDVVGGFTSRTEAARQTVDTLTTSLDRQTKVIGEQADAEQEAAAAREKKRQEDEAARKAEEEKRKAAERAREQERKAAEEERKRAEEGKELEAEIRENLAKRAEERKQTEAVMLMAAEAEMQAAQAQIDAERQLAEEQQRRRMAGVNAASTAVGMANGGPSAVMGAVASASPWGALIASIVELVGNFADVGDMFNDFTIGFNQSLGSLPDTLGENLGRWIETGTQSAIDMVPAFIQGLADNLPQIISSILESLVTMTGALLKAVFVEIPKAFGSLVETLTAKETWAAIWEGLVKALEEAIRKLFGTKENGEGKLFNQGGIFDQLFVGKRERENGTEGPGLFDKGGWFDTAGQNIATFAESLTGKYATGTDFVPRTGLALVHQGERIVPATGAASGRTSAMMGGGGGGVTINLGGGLLYGTPDQLAREVGRAAGRGVTWGSGG